MAEDINGANWKDDLPISTNEEFEIGYLCDELTSPMEICVPERAMKAAG